MKFSFGRSFMKIEACIDTQSYMIYLYLGTSRKNLVHQMLVEANMASADSREELVNFYFFLFCYCMFRVIYLFKFFLSLLNLT